MAKLTHGMMACSKMVSTRLFRLIWVLPILVLSILISPIKAKAGTLVYDAGVRASIFDVNYKLGLGAELGAVKGLNSNWDAGLHLNYSYFRNKSENWTSAQEFGARITAYYLPQVDQIFSLKLGPHIGYSRIRTNYFDLGGDLLVIFQVMPNTQVVAAFIPGFFLGENTQTLIRLGLGMQYNPGF